MDTGTCPPPLPSEITKPLWRDPIRPASPPPQPVLHRHPLLVFSFLPYTHRALPLLTVRPNAIIPIIAVVILITAPPSLAPSRR